MELEPEGQAGVTRTRSSCPCSWQTFLRCLLVAVAALSAPPDACAGTLARRLTPEVLGTVYPNAERLGEEEGAPPAIPVYKDAEIAGYIFSTLDVVAAPGYSSTPFDVIAGVTIDGIVTGAKVIFHREPDVLNDDTRKLKLDNLLSQHAGSTVQASTSNKQLLPPDFVAGATFTARSMRAAIYNSARLVLDARRPRPSVSIPTLDHETFAQRSWDELLGQGSVVRRRLSNRAAAAMLEAVGGPGVKPEFDYGSNPDDTYVEILTGLATPQGIGINLFGYTDYANYKAAAGPGGHIIAIASNGPHDYSRIRLNDGSLMERIRLVQGDRTIEFVREKFRSLGRRFLLTGIMNQQVPALYFLGPETGFDALQPWRLEIMIRGTDSSGNSVAAAFPIDYRLPATHILMPYVEPPPAWVEAWKDSLTNVEILGAALIALTLILVFQARLTRHRRVHRWVRNGFLVFTLVWLGWIAGGQLSIVNVTNYLLAPFNNFGIGFYLAEPLIVIVAVYTVVSLLLLGRGVFCGWLCPFGALQELLGQISRVLRLPQWNPSEGLQRRMWAVKYVAAVAVLGLAFINTDMATSASEIEPFKTAITSHFVRNWPFVLYAAGLLAVGLFTERAYCRFLCPLGGTLALLDRLHLIEMLERRPECGNPCHLCETSCPVKAIETSGKIKMAECFQCLDCQVEYYDDRRCPPLATTRKLRQRRDTALPANSGTTWL
jgi:NosR/NirI family transcriptional regulator, nitrous oxide reductase regulator